MEYVKRVTMSFLIAFNYYIVLVGINYRITFSYNFYCLFSGKQKLGRPDL